MTVEVSPPSTSPSLLVRLVNLADQTAWGDFVRVYGPLVYRVLRRRGVPVSDAEDVTQAVFLRVMRGLQSFEYQPERGRFRDWLGKIVRNEAARHWHKGQRLGATSSLDVLEEPSANESDPEWIDAFYKHLLNEALKACESRFEPDTWSAFVAVWMNNEPSPAVALRMGQTVDWVYVAKSRCLAAVVAEVEQLSERGIPEGFATTGVLKTNDIPHVTPHRASAG